MLFDVRAAGLLLALAMSATCRGQRQNLAPEPATGSPATEEEALGTGPYPAGFLLTLNNRHWLDVNVFVLHDGQASRVGLVTASSSESMQLPAWLMGQGGRLRIMAEPVGDVGRYTTDLLVVQPGELVEVNVESQLSRSTYAVH
jgi:hypothetical protein